MLPQHCPWPWEGLPTDPGDPEWEEGRLRTKNREGGKWFGWIVAVVISCPTPNPMEDTWKN